MTKLVWDEVGQRLYESGLDQGVFYKEDTLGVAWNGLISVEEDMGSDTSEPRYFDGVKYLDQPSEGNYAATLTAFTYPEEFEEYQGVESLVAGLYVGDQASKPFGLSYRTKVGNDVQGLDLGYKIHILYNLTAVPAPATYETLSDGTSILAFNWSLTAVPEPIPNYRPTAHVILDSRDLPADLLTTLEAILYGGEGVATGMMVYDGGTPGSSGPGLIDGGGPEDVGEELPGEGFITGEARLPSISELFDIITFWGPMLIVPDDISGIATLVPGIGDITATNTPGIYSSLASTRLVPTGVSGIYQLVV